jgi:hypothetical protein
MLKKDKKAYKTVYTGVKYCNKCECQRVTYDNFCYNCNFKVIKEVDGNQKRAFKNVLIGIKKRRKQKKKLRFLTLTMSELQVNTKDFDKQKTLPNNFKVLKERINRLTVKHLVENGYMTNNQAIRKYGRENQRLTFRFDYFKVVTNEGNGVIHIIYDGQYLPYNYLVDNWNDIHNSWNVNIQLVDDLNKDDMRTTNYLVSQYVTNQNCTYSRYSMSKNWYSSFDRGVWDNFRRYYRKDDLYKRYDHYLDLRYVNEKSSGNMCLESFYGEII